MDLEVIYNIMLELEINHKELAYEFIKSVIQCRLFGNYDSDDFVIKALMVPIEFEQ